LVAVAELEVLGRRQGGSLMLGQVLKTGRVLKEEGQRRIKEREQRGWIGSNC